MEYTIEGKWGNVSNLFFDELSKSLYYIHQDRLFIINSHNSYNLSPYSKSFLSNIKKAAIDELKEALMIQTKPKKIKILSIKEVSLNKLKTKSEVLGFYLAKNRAIFWDCFLITENSLEFYKFEENLKPVHKNSVNFSISYYHFDPVSGIIVLYSSPYAVLYSLYSKKPVQLEKVQLESNIGEQPNVNNLLNYTKPQLDCKIVIVVNIYSKIYLLHLDGFQGILKVYKKSMVKYEVNIDPGAYGVRVIDNLIILQNYGLQESTIIDWQNNPSMFKLGHRGSFEINPTFITISHEFDLNLNEKKILKLKMNLSEWVSQMPDIRFSVLFLLRRTGNMDFSLDLLKNSVLSSQNIDPVLESLVKRQNSKVPLISQDTLYSKVFFPAFKSCKNFEFFSKTLLFYLKILLSSDENIETNLQILLIKSLIKAKNVTVLLDLMNHRIINDSKDIALLLVELSKKKCFDNGMILGIDMLYRLKLYTIVMDVLISNGDFMETMNLLTIHPCPGYDLTKIQKDSGDGYMNCAIQEFLKENIY